MNNTALGAENKKEQVNECRQYTVEDLFCCAYAPFFWQAIQIRYPEYATYNRELYALLAKVMGCNMRTAQSRVCNGLKIMRKARK